MKTHTDTDSRVGAKKNGVRTVAKRQVRNGAAITGIRRGSAAAREHKSSNT